MRKLTTSNRTMLTLGGLIVAAIFLLSLNILSTLELKNAQFDLTEDKLFTLSDGTREVLAGIDEPVTIRFYFSNKFSEVSTAHKNYATRVRELLEHYASLAGGKIRLKIIDPEPFSVDEDEAVNFGLQGIPLDQSGELGYFGMAATNSTDDRETIAFFEPRREPFLEYDLTRAIFDLSNPKKKVVGLITSLFMEADPTLQYKPWALVEQINQFFELRSIDIDAQVIADDIDVLLVVHPKSLDDKVLYAIDQYVLRGGKVLAFVDPHNESAVVSPRGQRGAGDSDLGKLFDAWGVKYVTDKFVGDRTAAIRVSARVGNRDVIADYLSWMNLNKTHMNSEDVITGQLSTLALASVGFFEAAKGATTKLTPLIMTSTNSGRLDVEDLQGEPNPAKIINKFKSENKSFTIGARLQGKVKTAFPDGPPKAKKEDKKDDDDKKVDLPAHVGESKEGVNLILVADTDMLSSQFWLREQDFFGERVRLPISNNADFLINALDNLSGSNALISLRSRGLSVRPFHLIDRLRNEAEDRYRKTEQTLVKKLDDLEGKLKGLKVDEKSKSGVILTSTQQKAFDKFRAEMFTTRKELRDVQLDLRRDIDRLDTQLKAVNIWTMPIIIAVVAIVLAMVRRRRYRRTAVAQG